MKVIPFPGVGSSDPVDLDGIIERVSCIREAFVETAAMELFELSLESLSRAGFDIDDPVYSKDVAMLYSSIFSLLLKTKKLGHPIQQLAEDNFEMGEDGDVIMLFDKESIQGRN